MNSLTETSAGITNNACLEKPNITFIHDRKKKEGPKKNKNINKKTAAQGNKSKKKEKKRISETKNKDPGKPKKISMFNKTNRNNLGVK